MFQRDFKLYFGNHFITWTPDHLNTGLIPWAEYWTSLVFRSSLYSYFFRSNPGAPPSWKSVRPTTAPPFYSATTPSRFCSAPTYLSRSVSHFNFCELQPTKSLLTRNPESLCSQLLFFHAVQHPHQISVNQGSDLSFVVKANSKCLHPKTKQIWIRSSLIRLVVLASRQID